MHVAHLHARDSITDLENEVTSEPWKSKVTIETRYSSRCGGHQSRSERGTKESRWSDGTASTGLSVLLEDQRPFFSCTVTCHSIHSSLLVLPMVVTKTHFPRLSFIFYFDLVSFCQTIHPRPHPIHSLLILMAPSPAPSLGLLVSSS